MDNRKENFLWELANRLRGSDFTYCIIQLVFLKGISTVKKIRKNKKIDLELLMDLLEMIQNNDFNPNLVLEVYEMIEDAYDKKIRINDSVRYMVNNVFTRPYECETIYRALSELFGFYTVDGAINYKEMFNDIIDYSSDRYNMRFLDISSSESVANLAIKLLDVKENESFLDPFCELNRVGININPKKLVGYDMNAESCKISSMMMILLGKDNFEFECCSFYSKSINGEKYDKIFCDGIIAWQVRENANPSISKAKRSEIFNVLLSYEYLKDSGVAFVTVPAGILFNSAVSYLDLRKKVVDDGLKAVISLPALWNFTSINTNILLIEKGYKGNVTFVNAIDSGITVDKSKKILSDEVIKEIEYVMNNEISASNSELNVYSEVVSREQIKDNGYILRCNDFIKIKKNQKTRDIEDIRNDLKAQYDMFKELIK